MSTSLPALGTVSYNGVTFSAAMKTVGIDSRMVYDAAERTVTYVVHRIRLKDTLFGAAPGGSIGTTTLNLRRRLTTPGQQFRYMGHGFDDLTINVDSVKDVVWGPKPRMIRWEPHADGAIELEWEVEVAIPECSNAKYERAYMEMNFRLSWRIDEAGLTTRTYSGHVAVPQTRASGGRRLRYSADEVRENVVPALLPGWSREEQVMELDESKCKLTFRVVDTEQPVPLQPGVIRCDARHDIETDKLLTSMWHGVVSADYELIQTMAPSKAWEYFLALVDVRLKQTRRYGTAQGSNVAVIPYAFRVSEPDIFGKNKVSLSMTYTFGSSLSAILRTSGLFLPVPGANYLTWRTSMQRAQGPRGLANMRFNAATEDQIIDLCISEPAILDRGGFKSVVPWGRDSALVASRPLPVNSWLHYSLKVFYDVQPGTAELKTLPLKPVEADVNTPVAVKPERKDFPEKPPGAKLMNFTSGYQTMYATPTADTSVIQERVAPTTIVTVEGSALRACYPIAAPTLSKVGDVEPVPYHQDGDGFKTWHAATWATGLPILAAKWRLSWILPRMMQSGMTAAPNPMYR